MFKNSFVTDFFLFCLRIFLAYKVLSFFKSFIFIFLLIYFLEFSYYIFSEKRVENSFAISFWFVEVLIFFHYCTISFFYYHPIFESICCFFISLESCCNWHSKIILSKYPNKGLFKIYFFNYLQILTTYINNFYTINVWKFSRFLTMHPPSIINVYCEPPLILHSISSFYLTLFNSKALFLFFSPHFCKI